MRLSALVVLFVTAAAVAVAIADEFPAPFNSGKDKGATPPLTAEEAVKKIRLPDGFKATVFAAEPDVQNPIACAWDSRGRLWIAENYTYAEASKTFDHSLRDRILIFEDTDNDGRHDKRTVFADNFKNLTSIELGYGGVYATAAPHLLFIPDKNRDDKPDGAPEVLLDGFDDWGIRHNFVNGLKWGPDGWLWGRHGIQATSNVGCPGAPDEDRVKLNCAIWRFHPVRKTFEVVCWGGTNPWGHDWTADGEGFFTNTVIGHVYHIIPGAHYERMYGEDLNPHIYQLLPQTGDHHHFDTAKSWTESRDGKANDLGGGHAHSGCMIYLGDNWPEQYRGKLFTINLHGRRINVERLERKGAGYTAKHEPDFAFFDDPWFRGVELTYGPDGGVYVLDWSDQGECHENDGVHRTSGRIYKITYGEVKKPALEKGDVAEWSDAKLMREAIGGQEWLARQARTVLGGRIADAKPENVRDRFFTPLVKFPYEAATDPGRYKLTNNRQFREMELTRIAGLLAMMQIHAYSAGFHFHLEQPFPWSADAYRPEHRLRMLLAATPHEIKRLIQEEALIDAKSPGYQTKSLPGMRLFRVEALTAPTEFRLLASLLARYPAEHRITAAAKLLAWSAGKDDPVLPSLIWNAIEPIASLPAVSGETPFVQLAFRGKFPQILRHAARRLTAELDRSPEKLDELLGLADLYFDEAKAKEITRGVSEGLRGRNKVAPPPHWAAFAAKAEKVPALAGDIRQLNVIFGDGRALNEIRDLALNNGTDLPTRRQALETLITSKAPDLRSVCEKLITNRDLAHLAIRGLALFDDERAAKLAIANWNNVRWDAHAGVISDFATRPVFTRALLEAVSAGKIEREEITPYHARQIAALNDPDISGRLAKVWGEVRTTPEAKRKRIIQLKANLTPDVLAKADIEKGRDVFTQACAACHRLYELGAEGTQLGPNLTGSGRQDIDYLLENIVDPGSLVPADYKLSILTMKDGRTLSGFISAQTDQTVTLRTMTDVQALPKTDIAKTEQSPHSLMPDGLLDTLSPEQIRDLFGFLMKK